MNVVIDRFLYIRSFKDINTEKYLKDIIKKHNVYISIDIYNFSIEILESNNYKFVKRFMALLTTDIDHNNFIGPVNINYTKCGMMENHTISLCMQNKCDYLIYFRNYCYDSLKKENKYDFDPIHIYDFVRKFC